MTELYRGPFPPTAELVPHAGPMVLVERLTAWGDGYAEGEVVVRDGARFVTDGAAPAVASMEYMAQVVAACLGYEAYRGGAGVRVGMIIAVRTMDLLVERFAVGDTLHITVQRQRGSESLSHFDCRTERDGELLATANMTLYHAERPPT
ncbi:MAG: hypothetical protein H6697_01930 [Myxococcales bacterium]|nr:hypothetical protein [Myxococcales bacterium]MCB9520184.1 hypothetical protein [Myxococcales bacterium]